MAWYQHFFFSNNLWAWCARSFPMWKCVSYPAFPKSWFSYSEWLQEFSPKGDPLGPVWLAVSLCILAVNALWWLKFKAARINPQDQIGGKSGLRCSEPLTCRLVMNSVPLSVCAVLAAWGQVIFLFRLPLWLAFQKGAASRKSSLFYYLTMSPLPIKESDFDSEDFLSSRTLIFVKRQQ